MRETFRDPSPNEPPANRRAAARQMARQVGPLWYRVWLALGLPVLR